LAIGDPLATAYRVQTDEPFDVYLPEDDVWGLSPFLPEGVYGPSVQDGIYLLVNPLTPGEHTIHFISTSVFLGNLFEQDVTYHITVVPGNKP